LLYFAAGETVVATVKMKFDRTDFGIRYGSGSFFDDLGDQAINDEVVLKMLLVESFEDRKGL
jgi:polyisoprenoid-binding protein YceI